MGPSHPQSSGSVLRWGLRWFVHWGSSQLRSSLRPAGWEASLGSSVTKPGLVPLELLGVAGGTVGSAAAAAPLVALPRGVQPGTGVGAVAAILWENCCMMPNVVSPCR